MQKIWASKLEGKTISQAERIISLTLSIEYLQRQAFGQTRERFEKADGSQQQTLPFAIDPIAEEQAIKETTEEITYVRNKAKAKHPGRMPLPEHLPVEEIKIYPEGDLEGMICIGAETTDELECIRASYYIKRYIRYKYVHKDREGVFIGSLPARILPKCIAGLDLLTSIVVDWVHGSHSLASTTTEI